jgi:hypothetical protein
MTTLTHTSGGFERAAHSPVRQHPARIATTKAQLAAIKRTVLCAVTILVATGALAAIIALKTAVYLSRLTY